MNQFYIWARRSSLWSFLATKVGISNKIIVILNAAEKTFVIESHGLNGYTRTSLSLEDIDYLQFGYKKHIKMTIILAILILLYSCSVAPVMGIFAPILGMVLAAWLAVWRYLSRCFYFRLCANSGNQIELAFSISVIENIPMNEQRAREIQSLIFDVKLQK